MTLKRRKTPICDWSERLAPPTLRPPARLLLQSNPPGTRIKSQLDGRLALVCGLPERARANLILVPVIIEGSTRHELWATHRSEVLPLAQQFKALGGTITAPAGYPLMPVV